MQLGTLYKLSDILIFTTDFTRLEACAGKYLRTKIAKHKAT